MFGQSLWEWCLDRVYGVDLGMVFGVDIQLCLDGVYGADLGMVFGVDI